MFLLCTCIIFLIVLFSSCKHNNSKYSYDREGVLDLIGAKQLACEVLDIKVTDKDENSTTIIIELYVSEKEFLKNEYFYNKQDELPPLITGELINYGIQMDSVIDFGINYKEYIIEKKNEKEFHPYYIYWIKPNQNLQNKSNILIYTIIPNEITLL